MAYWSVPVDDHGTQHSQHIWRVANWQDILCLTGQIMPENNS